MDAKGEDVVREGLLGDNGGGEEIQQEHIVYRDVCKGAKGERELEKMEIRDVVNLGGGGMRR